MALDQPAFSAPGPRLIGLHGRKKSGKDTVAGFIEEWAEDRGAAAVRQWYAKKMKESCAALLKIPVERIDDFKLNGRLQVVMDASNVMHGEPMGDDWWELSGREVLQYYGTESHRDIFGSDFWVDELMPIKPESDTWWANFDFVDVCIIADLRFENEWERVKSCGGEVWKIKRPKQPGEDDDTHISEKLLPDDWMDVIIDNDSDLERLKQKTWTALH